MNFPSVPSTDLDPSNQYAVSVQKIAQDQAKQLGQGAVKLIDQAAEVPPVGPNGEGTHVNTYA